MSVVVGASSGLGRCIGVGLARAWRTGRAPRAAADRLDDAAKEAGAGTLAIECDVTDEPSCRSAVAEAAARSRRHRRARLRAGDRPAAPASSTPTPTTWRRVFDTNVTGASLVTTAAIPHLTAARGTAATSRRSARRSPRPGRGSGRTR